MCSLFAVSEQLMEPLVNFDIKWQVDVFECQHQWRRGRGWGQLLIAPHF